MSEKVDNKDVIILFDSLYTHDETAEFQEADEWLAEMTGTVDGGVVIKCSDGELKFSKASLRKISSVKRKWGRHSSIQLPQIKCSTVEKIINWTEKEQESLDCLNIAHVYAAARDIGLPRTLEYAKRELGKYPGITKSLETLVFYASDKDDFLRKTLTHYIRHHGREILDSEEFITLVQKQPHTVCDALKGILSVKE